MSEGDFINLSNLSMCAHNGTHIDAPFHFFKDGKTVEKIPLEKTVGNCYVAAFEGVLTEADAGKVIACAKAADPAGEAYQKLLFRGECIVSVEAARVMVDEGVHLVAVESQTVGDPKAPFEVHEILLGREVVILEGVRLSEVKEGVYGLFAAPLSLGGLDGAPCRAVLMEQTIKS